MNYRRLGSSGVEVSVLGLGTMTFGAATDKAAGVKMINRAREAGVNFVDTADQYAGGLSEEVVGAAIRANREHWVLATKVGTRAGDGPNRGGCSRRWIMSRIDQSLERLNTDHVDLYYLHREDHHTRLEETLRALGDLVRAGKIRHFGVSNYRSWRIAEICRLCDAMGIDRPIASQPCYNAMNRTPEVEHLPACAHYGLGVVPYSPVARGVLSGKYAPGGEPPADSRAGRNDHRMMECEWRSESLAHAAVLRAHAEARGITASQFAIAWVLNNRMVSAAIAGPRTLEQWEDSLGAADYAFTSEDEALVDSLVPPGHPSTPGFNDPAYPVEGRVPRTGGTAPA